MDQIRIDTDLGWQWGGWTLAQGAPPVAGPGGAQPGQTTTTPGTGQQPLGPTGTPQQQPGGGMGFMFTLMIGFLLLMIMTSVFGSRKEKKKRAELLGSLARYDRVQTAGGLIGTIVEVKGDEVVLKIDESTNTKVHIIRSAVTGVIKKAKSESSGVSDSLEPAETAA